MDGTKQTGETKMNGLVFTIIFFLTAFFMVSGGLAYFFARLGVGVYKPDVKMVELTPYATILFLMATTGMFTFYGSAKTFQKNKVKGWMMLLLGFTLIMFSWMMLDLLLVASYS